MNDVKLLTVATLRRAAKKHGATVHDTSEGRVVSYGVEAPAGTMWAGAQCHELVVWWYRGNPSWKHEPIADTIQRMADGVMPCPDLASEEGCDWCEGR